MQYHRTTWGAGVIHGTRHINPMKGHRTFSMPIKPKKSELPPFKAA